MMKERVKIAEGKSNTVVILLSLFSEEEDWVKTLIWRMRLGTLSCVTQQGHVVDASEEDRVVEEQITDTGLYCCYLLFINRFVVRRRLRGEVGSDASGGVRKCEGELTLLSRHSSLRFELRTDGGPRKRRAGCVALRTFRMACEIIEQL
ncbi:unnamed protein product, partial [Iphiclides podalirius]